MKDHNGKNSRPYIEDLNRLEQIRHDVATEDAAFPTEVEHFEINPTLELAHLEWKVSQLLTTDDATDAAEPTRDGEWVMVWRDPHSGTVEVEAATNEELLILKMLVDGIDPAEVAAASHLTVEAIEHAMSHCAARGILIPPRSKIRRDTPDGSVEVDTFTLQWHITHACDLNCKHCYDRSKRSPLTLDQGIGVLEDLNSFCKQKHVSGHVCFTGGNPFLHPNFLELYAAAAERGFSTSILGNPVPPSQLEQIIKIQRPSYFQVSLEGLPEHNDDIRGDGFYQRVIEFLGILRDLEISSTVMLTLTRDNIDQALPLAERLKGHVDCFTYNRLSPVGSGATLSLPAREEYEAFVKAWVDAAQKNSAMAYKDNLINIELSRRGLNLFDGCTGHGCGAAFNFIAVLPDGEAHACRKFPSPIGNALEKKIAEIYDSENTRRYREGTSACNACKLKYACGGCLSIAHGHGLDIFNERDPHCFVEEES
jgi:selenobiotic family peptide radical SAM maturase